MYPESLSSIGGGEKQAIISESALRVRAALRSLIKTLTPSS